MESQFRAHDPDAHPQISCTSHLDGMLPEEILEFLSFQDAVVVIFLQHSRFQRQDLRML